ncbi:hypothetical protein [Pyrobaculum aerophilum]|uniref:Uncharacterized protein n=1 Tax=Pyrobaculum aerophilum TaxID=13773 RepID=A0A371QYR4_9CREN|nr:hypothetical protein [Pyrobaculum aerophilum]RFA94662.1 hypothetical protein CGL51_09360 [Pyrobaculum aerophilum]RFA95862.1 hypothetical protein CGL52_12085 [Pyrobaculum aerophilum]
MEWKIKARVLGEDFKAVFVIDREDNDIDSAKNSVLSHFSNPSNIKVVVVDPRHEAWLCMGLGHEAEKCRTSPEDVIARNRGESAGLRSGPARLTWEG